MTALVVQRGTMNSISVSTGIPVDIRVMIQRIVLQLLSCQTKPGILGMKLPSDLKLAWCLK